MESGTHEQLREAENRGSRLVYEAYDDKDSDLHLQYADQELTDEMLQEMRRKNAAAMQEAMRALREGGPPKLPAIGRGQMPRRRGGGLEGGGGEKKVRRRPGSIARRAETPTEVREAAAKESNERQARQERERGWDKGRGLGRAKPRRGGQQRLDGGKELQVNVEDANANADRREESEVALRLLDLQAEAHKAEMDLNKLLSSRPQGLFDRELTVAMGIMGRHNVLLKDYAKRSNVMFEEQTGDETGADEESSVMAPSTAAGGGLDGGRAKRKRREERLGKLLEEGAKLREQAMMIVRRGGGAACRAAGAAGDLVDLSASRLEHWDDGEDEEGKIEAPSAAGRRSLLLLHGLLKEQLDEAGSPELADGARQMRRQLERMHRKAWLENMEPTVQAFRRGEEAARRRASKRERMWQNHVSLYQSLSGSGDESREEDVVDNQERYIAETFQMLRSSGGWLGGPPPGSDEETLLETRLDELQRKNAEFESRSAYELRTPGGGLKQRFGDGDEDEEAQYVRRIERGRQRQRRDARHRRIQLAYGKRTDVLQWSPAKGFVSPAAGRDSPMRGYNADMSLSPIRGGDSSLSPVARRGGGAGGKSSLSPVRKSAAEVRRQIEMSAMKRLKMGSVPGMGAADAGWVDNVLPSATDVSDGETEEFDESFWKSRMAHSVMETIAGFQADERAKQEEIVRREMVHGKFEGRMKRMHAQSAEHVSVVQDRIFREVHHIRREVTTKVRSIYKRIAGAREKLERARMEEDNDLRQLMIQEAQAELIEVEAETVAMRKKMRNSTSIKVDFMPAYLKDFLVKDDSAQTLFDEGRVREMQARAMEQELEEERRAERAEKRAAGRAGRQAGREASVDEFEISGIKPEMAPEEKELLDECMHDAKQLNKVLRASHAKGKEAKEAETEAPDLAAEAMSTSTRLLEQALIMSRHLKKKMRGVRAKGLKGRLPKHLQNLKDLGLTPIMDAWKKGLIEPGVCEVVQGIELIDRLVTSAKRILHKLDLAEEITDDEAMQAQDFLESAIALSVETREKGRACMLDPAIGGDGVEIWRFPKHAQNLVISDESAIVLWEKGLIDARICGWVERVDEANLTTKLSLRHEANATEMGETSEGMQELAKMDVLQYKVDKAVDEIRQEIRTALAHGLALSRLPPHLQNLIKDPRPHMMLFHEGKTDPVLSVMEQRAEVMLKNKQKIDGLKKKAKRMMDAENKRQAMQAAGDFEESTLKEMLKLRAKMMLGGIDVEQLKGPIAQVFDEAEEDMEDEEGMELAKTAMEELGEEMGADPELMARIAALSRKTGKKDRAFSRIDWSQLVGQYAEDMHEPTEAFTGARGVDYSQPVEPELEIRHAFESDLPGADPISSGFCTADVSTGVWMMQLREEVNPELDHGLTDWPVKDHVHQRFPDGVVNEWGDDGSHSSISMEDYGVSGTEAEDTLKKTKEAKHYDSDDEKEEGKMERKRKQKETNKTRLQGKQRSGIPLEVRRKILKGIQEGKRTLKLDISNLELPYISKQVTDATFLEELYADHNILDEVEGSIGRLFNLRILSLTWNRIENPLPIPLFEMGVLRELRLSHNQLDFIEPEVANLSNLQKLLLDDNNLLEVPPELGKRTNLKHLALDKNELTDLPPRMATMFLLNILTLSRNLLTFIPKCIFSMQKLKVLHLHYNQIPEFPSQLSQLKSLQELNMAVNLLTEVSPIISKLTSLTKLDIQRNDIPVLGPEMGSLPLLVDLTLSKNKLSELPEEFSGLTSMTKMKLDSNMLTNLPVHFTHLSKLQVLDLRNNRFIAVAAAMGRVSTLSDLRLDGMLIQTPPPNIVDLGTAVMMRYLDRLDVSTFSNVLDLTDLSVPKKRIMVQKAVGKHKAKYRTIPEVPCKLHDFHWPHGWWSGCGKLQRSSLTTLKLGSNELRRLRGEELSGERGKCVVPHGMVNGAAPDWGWELDPMTMLSTLSLVDNRLLRLPEEFGLLTALTDLDISLNSLEKIDGLQWVNLTRMKRLNLRGNAPLEVLPFQLGMYDDLAWLDVTGCNINSPPPVIIQRGVRYIIDYLRRLYDGQTTRSVNLDGLYMLFVSHDIYNNSRTLASLSMRSNGLVQLPRQIGNMVLLRELHLDDNKLTSLPVDILELTGLATLTLRGNYFRRLFEEDEWWSGFSHLQHLDVSCNELQDVPPLIGAMTRLTNLDLSENRLKTLPLELSMCTSLTKLCVRNNLFRLPMAALAEDRDIGCLLEFLRTLYNARGGVSPSSTIGSRKGTLWLDLSNRPYRIVPPEVCSLTVLRTLKISSMGLEFISPSLSDLHLLEVLELHDNSLHDLPDELGSLTALRRLSLSRNWFARVPYCVAGMLSLKELQTDGNQITVVFAEARNLTNLTELNLAFNCLRQVSAHLADAASIHCLDLGGNQLSFIPPEFAKMTNLRRISLRDNYITELPLELHALSEGMISLIDVNNNGLKSPPPEIVSKGMECMFDYMRKMLEAKSSGRLDLSDMGLTYVPQEVMRFQLTTGTECTGLTSLILDGNDLDWLPGYLRTMTTLTHLSLRNCKFVRLPYFLGDLQNLKVVDVHGNDIAVPPSDIVARGVASMLKYMRAVDSSWWTKELDIAGQRFEQVPLEVCSIDSLTSLRMQNQMFKTIPDHIKALTSLTHLNIQHCLIVELPDNISGLYSLRELIINNNRLLTLPSGIGMCTALTELRAHENVLEELPKEIGNLSHMLDLRLFSNNLLELPDEVGLMRHLPAFRISINQLPLLTKGIGGLESVADLLIADNFLESLPPEIGLLTSITRLRATNNRLESLPDELANLHNMTELAVSDNRLKCLPPLGHLTALRNLQVANNPLVTPPDEIVRQGTFAMVNYLKLLQEADGAPMEAILRGQNSVEAFHDLIKQGAESGKMRLRSRLLASMPFQVFESEGTTELDVEGNVISEVPADIGRLFKLERAMFSYNQISTVHDNIKKCRMITALELRYNRLMAVPSCICQLRLERLELDSNDIQEIPSCMSSLHSLVHLSISNNHIRVVEEPSCRGLTRLKRLRMQQNELLVLPESFGCMTSLEELNLSFNHLTSLPQSISQLTGMLELKLSYNELQTRYLAVESMTKLQELHLTSNRLIGIPHTFGILKELRAFFIGCNDFPVDAHHQYLKTHEQVQAWLFLNMQYWAETQAKAEKDSKKKRRGLPG